MEYNISEILKIIGSGNRSLIGDGNLKISRLLTDSRSLTYPSETLFFALTTQSGDGHRYLRQLYDKGVRMITGKIERRYKRQIGEGCSSIPHQQQVYFT